MSGIRREQSRFRNATLTPQKDQRFLELRAANASSTSNCAAASADLLAFCMAGGTQVGVVPLEVADYKRGEPPASVPSAGFGDMAFSPFDSRKLAVGAADGCLKLWDVPLGAPPGAAAATAATVNGLGAINSLAFHRSAAQIAATGGKTGVHVVDLVKGAAARSFECKDVLSVDWSIDGALLACVSKDNAPAVFDPRTAAADAGLSAPKSELRAQRGFFFAESAAGQASFFVVGVDKMRNSRFELYDARNMAKPLLAAQLDLSQGTFLPLYDVDTQLLFMCSRGSTMLAMYDLTVTSALSRCGACNVEAPTQGLALIAKPACAVRSNEVQRIMRVTEGFIEPLSVAVPRKIVGFHEDLFPPTASGEPALGPDEWLAGANAPPRTAPVAALVEKRRAARGGGGAGSAVASAPAAAAAAASASAPAPAPALAASPAASPPQGRSPSASPTPEQGSEAKAADVSERRRALDSSLKRSPFANLRGEEPQSQAGTYFDVNVDPALPPGRNLVANSRFWACPHVALGGSAVLVRAHAQLGRVGKDAFVVRGHKSQVTAMDASVRQPALLATGAADERIKLFSIEEQGLAQDLSKETLELAVPGRANTLDFCPWVDELLVASTSNFDGPELQFIDLAAQRTRLALRKPHTEPILSVAFSPDASLVATTSKDGKTRIIDPRAADGAGALASEWEPPHKERDTRVAFVGDNSRLLTWGFEKGSVRSVALWDVRGAAAEPVARHSFDVFNGALLPFFDEDTGLLVAGSVGSRTLTLLHLRDGAFEALMPFQSQGDVLSLVVFSKASVNVRNAEVLRGLTLSAKERRVMPFSLVQPRKRLDYFQDDIFPPTRAHEALMAAPAWFAGERAAPRKVSLRPEGMTDLSQAPPEAMTENQLKHAAQLRKRNEAKPVGVLGKTAEEVRAHFNKIAAERTTASRWDEQPEDGNEVADDEWN